MGRRRRFGRLSVNRHAACWERRDTTPLLDLPGVRLLQSTCLIAGVREKSRQAVAHAKSYSMPRGDDPRSAVRLSMLLETVAAARQCQSLRSETQDCKWDGGLS